MEAEEIHVLDYIVVCISEFANKYEMHMKKWVDKKGKARKTLEKHVRASACIE